jgi:L-threonylcarbamoyladenylate synthase
VRRLSNIEDFKIGNLFFTMLDTEILKIDPEHPDRCVIEAAAEIIRRGGLVAFPTETVYGLGADAMNADAVAKIFVAKGRPADNPLIVHISDREMLGRLAAHIPKEANALAERFWPGPLTMVLNRLPDVPDIVSAGLRTVAVRMPNNPVARELVRAADTPIAAPSANTSGRPSPTTADHVTADLGGLIDMILDGGPTVIGIESTVVDLTGEPAAILRPGWITRDSLSEVIGFVEDTVAANRVERSPGTRRRHYMPRARVVLVEQLSSEAIRRVCLKQLESGPVAFIGHTPIRIDDRAFSGITLGVSAGEYAHSIYSAMRAADQSNAATIVIEGIDDRNEGAAVMDRLRRAASERISSEKG